MDKNKTHSIESSLSLLFDKPSDLLYKCPIFLLKCWLEYILSLGLSLRPTKIPGEVIPPHSEKKKIKTTIWYSDLKQFQNKQPEQ